MKAVPQLSAYHRVSCTCAIIATQPFQNICICIQVNIDRCFHVGYSLAVNNNSVCE